MLSDAVVDEYLERIGASRPAQPDLEALRHLQERHVLSVPFENIDYHLEGTRIHLDEKIVDKIVRLRRGGGCYELNPAFAMLLRALGYQVDILPGRVMLGGEFGAPLCHLALRVHLDEPWLVDVGFGKNSRFPLRTTTTEVQHDPHGEFRVVVAETGGFDVSINGNTQYRIDDMPCQVSDFYPTLWWYRTAPDSPFLHNLFCLLQKEDGRVVLKGNRLTRVDGNGVVTEELPDDDAVRKAYLEHFGIPLDELPKEPVIDPAEAIVMQID